MQCAFQILGGMAGVTGVCYGVGNPNNVVTSPFGWLYLEFDSSNNIKGQWVKTTAFGSSGWAAMPAFGVLFADDYGGVAPPFTPTGAAAAKDKVTGKIWWFDGTWA